MISLSDKSISRGRSTRVILILATEFTQVRIARIASSAHGASKPHEFLSLSGFIRMVPDSLITRRLYTRVMAFFDEQLRPASF